MEEQNKHRDWLKSHEGLRFLRNAEQGNTNRKWELNYSDENYDPTINLIEIGKRELIIEYDETSKIKNSEKKSTKEQRENWMNEIIKRVEKDNLKFELHDHKGKCPHLTLFLDRDATKEEKEAVMKQYASKESEEFLDTSLCGIHLIAVPYVKHWKYGTIKELVKSGGELIINVDKFKKNINNNNPREFIVKNLGGITAKIVSRIKITDLASEYGVKKGTGTKLYHCCFHKDEKPSLSLNDKKGFFKCFGCDKSGNIIDFVSECENISKEDAIIKLKERADIIDYRKRKEFSGDEVMKLREDVLLNLAAHHTRDATELLCEYLEKHEHIYTTRDDIKAEVWIYREGIYVPNGKTYIKEFCREILGEAYTPHLANEVINKIETDNYIDAKEFFNSESVEEIPVQNGVLNIITSELKVFTPKKIFFNKLPIKYDSTK